MKLLIVTFFLLLLTTGLVNASNRVRTRIIEDEKTLFIQIEGYQAGHAIHYRKTFQVGGMSKLQKELLKWRVFRAQGIGLPLHEISGLIFCGLGVASLAISIWVAGWRRRKMMRMNLSN